MLTPLVTVVTACIPSAADHLEAAAASVRRAREMFDIQWILVFDGPAESAVPDGADLVMELTQRRGVSVARNFALPNAHGEFLVNLDADDELDVDGLLAGIAVLQEEPALGWVACNRVLTTGERTVHWHGTRDWEVGAVAAEWSAPMAFHSNTLVMRTEEVRTVGGWPALPACQDLALTLLLSERRPGRSLSEVLIRYRAWEGQATAAGTFREEQKLAYAFIEDHITRVRREAGRGPVTAPVPLGGLGSRPV